MYVHTDHRNQFAILCCTAKRGILNLKTDIKSEDEADLPFCGCKGANTRMESRVWSNPNSLTNAGFPLSSTCCCLSITVHQT